MSHISLPSDIDIKFIEAHEGFSNRFVYPGGISGPTIGNGIDIGHLEQSTISMLFEGVDVAVFSRIKTGMGLKGDSAKAWTIKNRDIIIPSSILHKAVIYIYGNFWGDCIKRFKGIDAAPGYVKTAVFSCCYNRGVWNKALAIWAPMIATNNWKGIADSLWSMQQDHPLPGIRVRRRDEAKVIYKGLKLEAPK